MVGTALTRLCPPYDSAEAVGKLHKKMAPVKGAILSLLVVPVMMPLDDYRSIGITVVPAAMESAVVAEEPNARAAKVVTVPIILVVAADPEAEALGACNRWRCNRDSR
jgi:hypothetical protein